MAAIEVQVPCGSDVHRVLFRRGCLVLVDHDAAAEATMAALGGEALPCFDILRSWRSRAAWERALEPRGPGFHQLYRRPPMPPALHRPLEAGVIRGWERRRHRGDGHAGAMLAAATRNKGEAALASALRTAMQARPDHAGPVERCSVEIGAFATANGRMTSTSTSVAVRVRADWWRTVGHAGLALDGDNRFVVAAHPRLVLDWVERSPGRWSPFIVEFSAASGTELDNGRGL